MRRGSAAAFAIFLGAAGAVAAGCASLAGIEDLQLTGDASTGDVASGSSSGSASSSGGGAESGADSGAEAGSCKNGDVRCSGNAVQTCTAGTWGTPTACSGQTCIDGVCTGSCAPGQTNPVPCGNCGTNTQTCSATGAWTDASCTGEGTCAPGSPAQTCPTNTYGTQSCNASSCTWGACSCPASPACTPSGTQCSGADVETCDPCGQWGPGVACASGTCVNGQCQGTCTAGQTQCSGNGVQSCVSGSWGTATPCGSKTCVGGVCVGTCAPGQTDPVGCGNCGTDTETCGADGGWVQGSCTGQGVCAPTTKQACPSNAYGTEQCSASSCSWGPCSCSGSSTCTPNATQCSGAEVQTCNACGQWGTAAPCGPGMTCQGTSCVAQPTDCPGTFLLCDGFEGSTSLNSVWSQHVSPTGEGLTLQIDGQQHHMGSQALHIHVPALSNSSYVQDEIQEISTFSSGGILYFRAWYYLTQLPGVDNVGLMSFSSTENSESGSGGLDVGEPPGPLIDGESNTGGYDTKHTSTTSNMVVGSWTCLEMLVNTTYASPNLNGLMQVWQDTSTQSASVADLTGIAELQSLYEARFGIELVPPTSAAFDLYIDDVAIDTSFIPCDE